jgi:hypothetical protein
LYVKLHPVYETSKESYKAAFGGNSRVHVVLGNEPPSTFELLTQAQLHVSISSTCHYDALGLGVPTVILPFTTHDIVLSLHQAGHAYLAYTPQELLEIVLHCKDHAVPPEISEWYFTSGALENIKRELELA